MMTGKLITFEGIDLCGKSVQIEQLVAKLHDRNYPFLLLREPGGTLIAEKIRDTLLSKVPEPMNPITEYLLYSAARAQLVQEKIIPALQQGRLVICDRFFDSSTAYQGYGRGIDLDFVERTNRFVTQGIVPNLTFLIDIDIDEMEQRKKRMNKQLDRMEDQDRTFFERVRNGYFEIAAKQSERFRIIDGKSTIQIIADEIWAQVKRIVALNE
ncbi:MAG: dTMP kinase [candidate division KSB1 bacterium]|nr:dTMP kinase [candidate division KSB1 bacterium]MDZ7334805.1 dTMP kinase [candidate division KSB1 bacterium]MDZ7357598.1 dTMP kinase [candidate division KSB1 bacterium]MDZ7375638.1 dTMP kinase [candidate division KSB1 bacterium]MDZ7400802.1 dTMP kinase [candidate division KSB1 bacterium]